ncbi:MAG: fibronectin type III domain-containing protein [Desulfosarcina sp.]
MKQSARTYLKVFFVSFVIVAVGATAAWSADVSLRWDPNEPPPQGYRIFAREGSQSYNYSNPIWQGSQSTHTLIGLKEGVTYSFVVRAFEGNLESLDSDEVTYTPLVVDATEPPPQPSDDPPPQPDDSVPQPDDSVPQPDDLDKEPENPEPVIHGPVIISPTDDADLGLTPILLCEGDWSGHTQSRWQISTEADFSTLVLDESSHSQLHVYAVRDMILDVETHYYWRVRFIDGAGAGSDWSETATFRTLLAVDSDDKNLNGTPDDQEVDCSVDGNNNEIPGCQKANFTSFLAVDGKTLLGIETVSEGAELVAVRSLPADRIDDPAVKMETSLVGFKLYLQDWATSATVTVHYSKPVSRDAQVLKYDPDAGFVVFENAVFSRDRKSVTLIIEDGGPGDEDGVKNGVIVDPFTVGYVDPLVTNSASLSTGDSESGVGVDVSSCFISTANHGTRFLDGSFSIASGWWLMLLLAAGMACAFRSRGSHRR